MATLSRVSRRHRRPEAARRVSPPCLTRIYFLGARHAFLRPCRRLSLAAHGAANGSVHGLRACQNVHVSTSAIAYSTYFSRIKGSRSSMPAANYRGLSCDATSSRRLCLCIRRNFLGNAFAATKSLSCRVVSLATCLMATIAKGNAVFCRTTYNAFP